MLREGSEFEEESNGQDKKDSDRAKYYLLLCHSGLCWQFSRLGIRAFFLPSRLMAK
jgi:hypothetical protein